MKESIYTPQIVSFFKNELKKKLNKWEELLYFIFYYYNGTWGAPCMDRDDLHITRLIKFSGGTYGCVINNLKFLHDNDLIIIKGPKIGALKKFIYLTGRGIFYCQLIETRYHVLTRNHFVIEEKEDIISYLL